MLRHLHRTAVVGAVGAVLLAAGCGGSGNNETSDQTPKSQLTAAIENLGDGKTLTMTLKLGASSSDLQSLAQATGDTMDARTAGLLSGAKIVVHVKSDENLKDMSGTEAGKADMRLFADVDGSEVVELRIVDQTLYLKADVKKILDIAQNPDMYTQLQAQAAQLPPFVQAALAGKWVSLPSDTAKSLAEQFGGNATATPDPAQAKKLLDGLKAALAQDVEVTREDTDSDKGDHLVLKASSRKLVTDLMGVVSSAGLPAGAAEQFKPGDVPDRTVTVDAWVKDDKLSQISLDLVQFAEGDDAAKLSGKSAPLVIEFGDKVDSIAKPDGATPIDLSQILPLLGALGGGTAGEPAPFGDMNSPMG